MKPRLINLIILFYVIIETKQFDYALSELALEFAAAAYADDALPCVLKNNATLLFFEKEKCDYLGDECWSLIASDENYVFVGFSGTKTKEQLIVELLTSIGRPKHKLHNAGSVHYYFYAALKSMWPNLSIVLKKVIKQMPKKPIIFTGHSLGGALASIASTVFVRNHPNIAHRAYLITFGQPRVGNIEYASTHDNLVKAGSWRLVHGADIVAHIPLCVESFWRTCIPFYNHGSYHHGVEVWFPGTMKDDDLFIICEGLPLNEDNACSNSRRIYDINDHLFYFGHHVSEYGLNGCRD